MIYFREFQDREGDTLGLTQKGFGVIVFIHLIVLSLLGAGVAVATETGVRESFLAYMFGGDAEILVIKIV